MMQRNKRKKWFLFFALAAFCMPLAVHAEAVIQLPRTGQTVCYDTAGATIACTGTGQDGDVLAGAAWPSPSRYTNNIDNTVTDHLTGLSWRKDGLDPAMGVGVGICNGVIQNGYSFDNDGMASGDHHPVETVSWYDVVKWQNARSEKEVRQPVYYTDAARTTVYRTGQIDVAAGAVNWDTDGYRLPTEAEWEYAARAGTTTRFYTGDCISSTQANYPFNLAYPGCPANPQVYRGSSTAVGSFPANPWGLYDMAGNVQEWTWDWDGPYAANAATDPRGPASGQTRVMRGGEWSYSYANYLRSAFRSWAFPDYNESYNGVGNGIGFRSAFRP